MTTKNHVLELDNRQLITFHDTSYKLVVKAPLPESFNIGAGSEINSPFASFASDGTAASLLALTTGASSRIGITTKKLFMGPDQPDISVDLKFEAYYSAYEEVLIPCIKLLLMSTGDERDLLKDTGLKSVLQSITEKLQSSAQVDESDVSKTIKTDNVGTDDLINYLKTPSALKVKFGNVLTVYNAFLSSVSVNFSNVLDHNFLPMEATVSVTITPQDPFTKKTLIGSFKDRITTGNGG